MRVSGAAATIRWSIFTGLFPIKHWIDYEAHREKVIVESPVAGEPVHLVRLYDLGARESLSARGASCRRC